MRRGCVLKNIGHDDGRSEVGEATCGAQRMVLVDTGVGRIPANAESSVALVKAIGGVHKLLVDVLTLLPEFADANGHLGGPIARAPVGLCGGT